MASRTKISEQVDALKFGVTSYEVQAKAVYDEAQRAAALIPMPEFEEHTPVGFSRVFRA